MIPDGAELYRRLHEKFAVRRSDDGVYFNSPDNLPDDDEYSTSDDLQITLGTSSEPDEQLGTTDTATPQRTVRLLLLGQSESGKSTLLRQFERLYAPELFERERMKWRGVVQKNVISSMRTVLHAVDPAVLNSTVDSEALSGINSLKTLAAALPDVTDIQNHTSPGEDLTARSELQRTEIHSKQITADSFPSSAELGTATQSVLDSLRGDMMRLWGDPHVQATLQAKQIQLENSPGFFLDDLPRVTAVDYVPSDDDVMRARLETTSPSEHTFKMSGNETWSIIDVGGSKTQVRYPVFLKFGVEPLLSAAP
ncbi:G-protein alpha subunit-domain-containing protein [Mycena rosella]|uniref:G-protein alpha subunit-domain-containing protein n=1 Tax=Mycena rosella TaxID=1033263 RepID=A0AAD7GPB8_MYCRO|nr:G-protein alpha subunit-domain-containing protein [Mycena rosella]